MLLNMAEDKYRRFEREYAIVATDFYDLAQQSVLASFVREHAGEGALFFGGFEDAERRGIIFLPDYLGIGSQRELADFFRDNPQECPYAILDVKTGQKDAGLKHSDYLGSLLALGIKREKTGDILVSHSGAQIFVTKEIAPYLAENYTKAGRVSLNVRMIPISELMVTSPDLKRMRIAIASPRLDNAVAAVFSLSRRSAAEAISKGLVFVNNMEAKKPDLYLKGGEKLVLRGRGKAIYLGDCGTSRKGKTYAEFDRYI